MEKFRFYKEGNNWYVDLPIWEGPKSDLLMIGGADTMLDIISNNGTEVNTFISREIFNGASELKYVSLAEDVGEGAYYVLENYKGDVLNLSVFLCDVTKFVFGDFPKQIFISASTPLLEEIYKLKGLEEKIDNLKDLLKEGESKLVFGLSPIATLVNSIIIIVLASISWCIGFFRQIPIGTHFTKATQVDDLNISVSWFYDMPLVLLGMIMLFKWIDYKFKFQSDDFSMKSTIYKYVYGVIFVMLVQFITKLIILTIFLK